MGMSKMIKELMIKELGEAWKFVKFVDFWRMAVLWTISLLFSYFQLFFRSFLSSSRSFKRCSSVATQIIKPLCVVTGATSGLGLATALALSRHGFYVVLAGRSPHLLSKAMTEIKNQNNDALLKAFQVDLSSFKSILNFKNSLQQWLLDSEMHPSVQLLINNAGILATSSRVTSEGYDQMMGTNYLGPFSLTKRLLPLMENSPIPSRIVNVTSFTHRGVFDIQVDKETIAGKCFMGLKGYPCARIYEYSKLCVLLFSYELNRQLAMMDKVPQISVIAADPGVVKTNIMREVPSCLSCAAFTVLKFLGLLQSPKDGVGSILDAALAPPEASGLYFFGGKGRIINSSALSYNAKFAEKLWNTSCDLFSESQLASNQ